MSIWSVPVTVEMLNKKLVNNMTAHLGIQFTEVGDDFLKATMPVDERTTQAYGILHGGASAALAETLGSVAGAFCIDLNMNRFRFD